MPRLSVTSSKVVAEVIDGEAIVLDLRAGSYFATDGVGAVAWAAAVDGFTTEDITASADAFYPGAGAGGEVAAVLDKFVEADLLVTSEETGAQASGHIVWPADYAAPSFERHDDLQEMMTFDPIHDTDATGWPTRAATPTA